MVNQARCVISQMDSVVFFCFFFLKVLCIARERLGMQCLLSLSFSYHPIKVPLPFLISLQACNRVPFYVLVWRQDECARQDAEPTERKL